MMKTNLCPTAAAAAAARKDELPSTQQLPSTTKCIIQYLPQGYRTYLLSNILEVPPEFNPWEVGQIVPSTLGLTFKDETSSSSSSKMEPLADNEDNETSSEHHMSILQRSIPEGIEVYVLSSSVTAPIPENLVGSFRVALVSSVSSNQVHPFATSPPSIQTIDDTGECTTESLEDCCLYSREKCARLHYPGSPDPTRTDCCRVSFACRHSSMIRSAILNERLVLSSVSSSDLQKEQQVSSNDDDDDAVQLASATDVSSTSTTTTELRQQKHQSSSAQKKKSAPTSSAKRTQTKTRVTNTEKTPSKSSSSTTTNENNKGTPAETPKQARKIPKVNWIRNKLKEQYMKDHPEETSKNTKACSAHVNKIWESNREELEQTWAEEYAQYERDFNTQKKLSQGSAPQSKTSASKPSTTVKKDSAIPTKVLSKRKTSDSHKEESPAPKKAKSTAPSSKRQQQPDEKESNSVEQKKKKVSLSSSSSSSYYYPQILTHPLFFTKDRDILQST